ncbi:hypothetical protein MMC24_005514 [Lignoscripta atroalba]|nr:hypothetical protein [Lignoscripta atroalba]
MKFSIVTLLLALFTLAATGRAPQKQVIVSYPKDTPETILHQAKAAIEAAGGVITHEYELIKGFAATASAKALDTVSELSAEFSPTIEEDQIVTIYGSS